MLDLSRYPHQDFQYKVWVRATPLLPTTRNKRVVREKPLSALWADARMCRRHVFCYNCIKAAQKVSCEPKRESSIAVPVLTVSMSSVLPPSWPIRHRRSAQRAGQSYKPRTSTGYTYDPVRKSAAEPALYTGGGFLIREAFVRDPAARSKGRESSF